ncbi:siderophore-interacting protein [Agromyces lapidis]|uniref:Siderophore-interacting protein n=1 Tax=Agromyces lapidis TaxID=279574 RepID=A0ABV5STQ0_9MICO|nr:siderophore-interacting protein [Agromyces lapidis]
MTAFTLARRSNELVFRPARLASRRFLTADYVRVRLEGEALIGFDSPGADDHIRVFFPSAGTDGAALSVDELRAAPSREYTPLAWDASAGTLDLEFLVHGDEGIAGRWAADAAIGASVGVGGPRGSLVIEGEPEGWRLAGDETALPAMRRLAGRMPRDARGLVVIEANGAAADYGLEAPEGVRVEWLARGAGSPSAALIARLDALTADDRPEGDVFAFVAAEQAVVKPCRALLERWGLGAERAIVKGYWRRGDAEYHAPH